MTILWNDNLRTGIAIIDEQHQELFETINSLEKCKISEAYFYSILSALNRYISVHFKTEEDYMHHTAYPNYNRHKECHEQFTVDYKNLLKQNSSKQGIMDSRLELIAFIENWLKNHYETEDLEMADYLKKQRGSS